MQNEDFLSQKAENGSQMIKSITYTTFPERISKTSKNLIKPMENEDFWSRKSKKGPKKTKKALPTQRFRNAFPKSPKTL